MKFFHCFSTDKTASMESFARLLIAIPLVSYVLAVLSLWVGLQINSFIFRLLYVYRFYGSVPIGESGDA